MNTFPLLETGFLSPEAEHRIFTVLAREMTLDAPAVPVDGAELVEDATISYLQPDEPARRNRRPWLLALVAAAATVLAAGIMVRDNSTRTRTGDVTPETMPIYLPTVLPDGFKFYDGGDSTNRVNPPFRDQVYRNPSKSIGTSAVQITTSLASAWGGVPLGHPIVIQGRPAFDESDRGLPAIRLNEGPVSIHISGRGVSYEEIERIAGSAKAASPNPTDGAVVSFVPDGLNLVLDQTTTPPSREILAIYSLPDNTGLNQLEVNIWPTSSLNLDQWVFGRSGELTQTTVRGHDAIRVASEQSSSFVWSESTGVLIEVNGIGIPADKVRDAAESVRRVSLNEWNSLLKSRDIAIQDNGAPGSSGTIAPATTAAANPVNRVEPWAMPLLVPQATGDLGDLMGANDRYVEANLEAPVPFSQRLIYRATGTTPGSRAVQVELFHSRPIEPNPSTVTVEGQAPLTEAVLDESVLRMNGIDPDGLYFRLSGRGFTRSELETVAKSITATWTAERTNLASLVPGFGEVESHGTGIEQYRSTTLDYGSISISMNPVGSGGIESYAIATPGSFTATKVRGRDGYIVTDPATSTLRLVWAEAPGLLVEVKGIGTDEARLQRLAESLQPASTDAWKKILATVGAKPETVKTP